MFGGQVPTGQEKSITTYRSALGSHYWCSRKDPLWAQRETQSVFFPRDLLGCAWQVWASMISTKPSKPGSC